MQNLDSIGQLLNDSEVITLMYTNSYVHHTIFNSSQTTGGFYTTCTISDSCILFAQGTTGNYSEYTVNPC